ncbi:DNA-protecting protein DprA [bacterium]|nr:DNA-protecting protein DprA [bacterium]
MGLSDSERIALLNLLAVPGVGSWGALRLVQAFGLPSDVFHASEAALRSVPRVGERIIEGLRGKRSDAEPGLMQFESVRQCSAALLTFWDDDYPDLLKKIDQDAPVVLFVRGKLASEGNRVSFVGTRRATEYGKRATRELIAGLQGKEIEVISGLASGIDGAAHQAALDCGLTTHAVFGCGVDIIYPDHNKPLAEKILESGGSLISEYPPGTQPSAYTFPQRNRIIAGLCQATLVVEAPEKSGALITARLAGEYGREVAAVPGSIVGGRSNGCHELLKNGAALIDSAEDILSLLKVRGPSPARLQSEQLTLPGPDGVLLGLLSASDSVHIDMLTEKSELAPGDALSRLLMLELQGLVKQLPGKYFIRV